MRRILMILIVFFSITGSSTHVFACGNTVELQLEEVKKTVMKANRDLSNGKPERALFRLSQVWHFSLNGNNSPLFLGGNTDKPKSKQGKDLVFRAKRIAAISIVRLRYKTKIRFSIEGKKLQTKQRLREFSAAILKVFAESKKPIARMWRAEQILSIDPHSEKGLGILRKLRDNNVMPNQHGWFALAAAESLVGNSEAASDALKKGKMARKQNRLHKRR